uniref:DUF1441 family protein n=2 Tax=Escherichia coli TaxID=562 RepID=UPI000AD71994
MDHELKKLVLNINQLAALSGLHRQTVVARLKNIRPAGGHDKLKLYRLTDILTEFMGKRAARTVLTGMCYSVGSATRQGSSSPTRFIGQ